jgi:hypothetical protein
LAVPDTFESMLYMFWACYETFGTCYLACSVPLGTYNMGVH